MPGHDLSFKEEQELHLIRSNLEYDDKDRCWITSYPWIADPSELPDNYPAAKATLKRIEKSLSRDPVWAENTVDWLTRGCLPSEIGPESDWFNGPQMLHQPFDSWNIKFGKTNDKSVPGEKKLVGTHLSDSCEQESTLINNKNVGTFSKAVRVVAPLMGIAKHKSLKGGCFSHITPDSLRRAEEFLLKDSQKHVDLSSADYRRLNPVKNVKELWVVGANRLANFNPLNGIKAELPTFIPRGHPLAQLAMEEAHRRGHRGRDATLALF